MFSRGGNFRGEDKSSKIIPHAKISTFTVFIFNKLILSPYKISTLTVFIFNKLILIYRLICLCKKILASVFVRIIIYTF